VDHVVSYEEFPVYLPMGEERLCGVVCVPGGIGCDLGVVLLTGGNYTRTHRNRMWVRTARLLAERGFPSIRVDYHGVGDSTGTAHFDLEIPFDRDAVSAADFLQAATGVRQLALVATCFGGRSAMAAAAQHSSVVSVTIFPLPLTVPRDRLRRPLRSRIKLWLRRRSWGPQVLRLRAVRRLRSTVSTQRARAVIVSPRFKRDLEAFLQRGTVRFVFGELTASLPEVHGLVEEILPRLIPQHRERLKVEVVPGTDLHQFQTLGDQDVTVDRAVASVSATDTASIAAEATR
jgi:pimeloyl-ACP methyl ester carboxylesterase